MPSEWLGLAMIALTLLGWTAMALVVAGLLFHIRLHLRLRAQGLELERRRLAWPLPPDQDLPHVVVQLPTFNEGALVERAIRNATELDWPKDKLHVQVCDDSTDDTTERAWAAAGAAGARGFDVEVLHRADRTAFKAGALQAAMARSGHGFFLILDVDFLTAPDFLRRTMAALLSEPDLAFVQARPDFFNRGENALTRAQAIFLDWHYGLEQPTRSWAGHVLPFNGTCGIWRREAVEAAGGWSGDTLTEDWELAFRARSRGWSGAYLTTVAAHGEVPTSLATWMRQQQRWGAGVGQVGMEMLRRLVGPGAVTGEARRGALLPFAMWLGYAAFVATLVPAGAAMLLDPAIAPGLALFVYLPYGAGTLALFAGALVANRSLGRGTSLPAFLWDFLPVPAMFLYMSWVNVRSLPGTLRGRRRTFVRTPKRGTVPVRAPIKGTEFG